jgi:hypothetical protein
MAAMPEPAPEPPPPGEEDEAEGLSALEMLQVPHAASHHHSVRHSDDVLF